MLYRSKFYVLDCGRRFYFCPLRISAPPALIPPVLLNFLEPATLGYCSFPVNPRKAILKKDDGEIFTIEYPFSASMPEWLQFWEELQRNSLITYNIGEIVPDSILRNWLL